MRSFLVKAALAIAITPLFLSASAKAQDNDGCTNATLKGDYAFTISGQVFLPTGLTIDRAGIAMTHFRGDGTLSQVDLVKASANAPTPSGVSQVDPVTGFNINESGTYTVHPDCTGTLTIVFEDMTDPTTGLPVSNQVIVASFVLSDHGHAIHTVVTSLTPAGKPKAVPVLIRSDGYKVGSVREN